MGTEGDEWQRARRTYAHVDGWSGRDSHAGRYLAVAFVVVAAAVWMGIHALLPVAGSAAPQGAHGVVPPAQRPTDLPAGAPDPCVVGTWRRVHHLMSLYGKDVTLTFTGGATWTRTLRPDGTGLVMWTADGVDRGVDNENNTWTITFSGANQEAFVYRASAGKYEVTGHRPSGAVLHVDRDGVALRDANLDTGDISDIGIGSAAIIQPVAVNPVVAGVHTSYSCTPRRSLTMTYSGTFYDQTDQWVWVGPV